jgi:hypothetical protein
VAAAETLRAVQRCVLFSSSSFERKEGGSVDKDCNILIWTWLTDVSEQEEIKRLITTSL